MCNSVGEYVHIFDCQEMPPELYKKYLESTSEYSNNVYIEWSWHEFSKKYLPSNESEKIIKEVQDWMLETDPSIIEDVDSDNCLILVNHWW